MAIAPGPPGKFLTGHLAEFRADRLAFFTRCAREYGDIVPIRLLHFDVLLVSRPDLVEQVLVHHTKNSIKHFGLRFFKPLLGEGLVTSEGELWRRQRKLSAPAFVTAKLVRYSQTMVDITLAMLDTWAQDGIRDVHADMMQLTLDIAVKTLFGADVGASSSVVGGAMETAMICLAKRWRHSLLPFWFPTPNRLRFLRAVSTIDAIVSRIVAHRRSRGPGDDLLSMLLSARDDDGSAMSERQIQDEVRTILLAGHETTALALGYSLYLLGLNPDVQDKLREEVQRVLGDRTPNHTDLPKLDYTRKVITETMRLYPPADFLGREATIDLKLDDIEVRRGTNLFVSQWVMHRDPRYFPDPLRYNPDRWTEEFEKSLPRFAYFPFGAGPRFCIGQNFAMMETVLALAAICQRYRFSPDPTFTLELWPNITLRPKHGLRVHVERSNAADIQRSVPEQLVTPG